VIATRFLTDLEQAGARLRREGDSLRIDAPQALDLAPWLPRLIALKPVLLAALDWYAAVTVREGFDRDRVDRLYVRLGSLERTIEVRGLVAERQLPASAVSLDTTAAASSEDQEQDAGQ
jgi:hypothetical protein